MLPDPIALTILATIFRGAAVFLLLVAFAPTGAIVWLFARHRG